MLRIILIVIACRFVQVPLPAFSQSSGIFGLSDERLQTLFQAQIRMGFRDNDRVFEKSLVWHEASHFQSAIQHHKVGDSLAYVIMQELAPALEVSCLNPEISEWFDIQQSCSRIEARRKTGMDTKTRLEAQTLQLNAACDKILFIETLLSRHNWLYKEHVRLRIYFTQEGRYACHLTEIMTDVPLSGAFICMVSKGLIRAKGSR